MRKILLMLFLFQHLYVGAQITVEITGPTTANVGETKNYTLIWRDGFYQITPPGGGTAYWNAIGGTVPYGDESGGSVQWTASGLRSVFFEYYTWNDFYYDDLMVTVSASAPAMPNTTFTITQNCGSTNVLRNSNPPSGVQWYWQTTSSGTSTSEYASSTNRISSGNLYLRARQSTSPYTWSTSSQYVGNISVITTPPSVPATSTGNDIISSTGGQVTVSVSSVSGATSYRWYTVASGGTAIGGVSGTSYSPTLTQTTTYHVESVIGNCASTTRRSVTAGVHPAPQIASTNNGVITMGTPVTLSLNYTYDTYQWRRNGANISGAIASTYQASQAGDYTVQVSKGTATDVVSVAKLIGSGPAGQNMNYIVSNTILKAGVTEADIDTLGVKSLSQTIQYFDGLGRPVQSVVTQGSPNKKDIVQPVVYDQFGREARKYLPYVATTNDGWYKANPVGTTNYTGSPHHTFYNETNSLIARDAAPYSETVFEPSPLNRIIKQGAPGATWQPDGTLSYASNDHTIKMGYEFNAASEVLLWTFTYPTEQFTKTAVNAFGKINAGTAASPVFYAANQLYKNMTKDEHGNQVVEYVDKQGRTILKRVQAKSGTPPATTGPNKDSDYASTYYIYDDFGNLVCVIPPEATKRLATEYYQSGSTDSTKNTFLKRWAFRYRYDGRKRMIMKQVPGAEPVYMVYDNRDRLVLTQDGNQRTDAGGNITKKEWTFTKYDVLNRPVLTGIYEHDVVADHATMSGQINTTVFAESYDQAEPHGYTTDIFPNTNLTVHTVTFYDNYEFKDDLIAGTAYDFNGSHLSGQVPAFDRVKGQVTGTKVNVLGTGDYLWTVNYYDDRYRLIQSVQQNYKGGQDRITSIYDFVGRVLKTKSTHVTTSESTDITRIFAYDHAGRLLSVKHDIDGDREVTIVSNQYNELGELIKKKLHKQGQSGEYVTADPGVGQPGVTYSNTLEADEYHGETALIANTQVLLKPGFTATSGSTFSARIGYSQADAQAHNSSIEEYYAQEVDYRYNIRGWLNSINDPAINANALFNFQLKYHDPVTNGGDAQYNGNISQAIWKTAGSDEASYGYSYDVMNRITEAKYFNHIRPTENNRFNEAIKDGSNSGYDLNGNIRKLQRNGSLTANTYGLMDNLTYTYTGNQLTRVDDAIATQTHENGFKELIKTSNEYTYDANGNMLKDQNKGITAITYNLLNLPAQVNKGATNYIVYTYDATGRKLKQQVYGATPKTTDYAGEFIYENDTLRFINHEEGRILPDTSSTAQHPWEYQYHLKDHLGNVRVTFSENTTTEEFLATMEKDPSSIDTEENNMFLNMVSSKKIAFYNHTPNAQTGYSYRLSASSTELIGPAKSFEVNSGDVVDLEVYVRYANLTTTNSGLSNLFNSLVGAFSLNPGGGIGLEGQQAYNAFNGMFGSGAFIGSGDWDENAPKAYLNYILFDEDFNLIDFGFDQLSQSAGSAHELLSLHVKVQQKGYLYIYLSNENDKIVDVYFDDFKIVYHTAVEQRDDYYPFGGVFNSYSRENSTPNQNLYQGKELQDELSLGIYDFHARGYDPMLGRTWQTDPLSEKFYGYSPYSWVKNNPLLRIDPTGMDDYTINKKTGDVTLVKKTDDETDRVVKTKQFGKHKGEVKTNRKGEAKTAFGGVEKGILNNGQNFKTQNNIIAVGGEGKPSETGVEAFALKLSNYVGKEIGGAYFGGENTTHMTIGMYKFNEHKKTRSMGHTLGMAQGLNLTGFFHTHPGNGHDISNSDRLVPSDQDLDSRDAALKHNPSLKFFLITEPENYGDEYPNKIPYTTGYSRRLR